MRHRGENRTREQGGAKLKGTRIVKQRSAGVSFRVTDARTAPRYSLLASLGSVQFVSNVVFGKFVLGEKVYCRTWVATLVICVGNILIVFYSNRDTKEFTTTELIRAYTLDYRWYCLAILVILVLVQRIYNYCGMLIEGYQTKRLVPPNGYKVGGRHEVVSYVYMRYNAFAVASLQPSFAPCPISRANSVCPLLCFS